MSPEKPKLTIQGKEAWVRWATDSAPSLGRVVSICFSQKDDCWKALIIRDDGTFYEDAVGNLKIRHA